MGKKMRNKLYTFLILLPCLTAYGQQGFIDYDQVVKTLPDYGLAQKVLDARTKLWQDSIRVRVKTFTDFLENDFHILES
jgi:hypothetical protein